MAISKYNVQVKGILSSSSVYKTIQLDIDEEIVKMCSGNKERLTRALEVFVKPYFAVYKTLQEVKVINCRKA